MIGPHAIITKLTREARHKSMRFAMKQKNKLKKLLTSDQTSDILKKLSRLTTKQRTLITEQ